ncbi:dephospho-CoA kinase [Algiphilus sp.]|uniref:dephospho-CoA kinase n=1 Tax=Algiphilus sp. TaxID=1872431 RepID=UPI0032F0791F
MALVIGLTGGVASGKSTVEAAFRALDVPVIDADQVARAVVEPGEPALAAIVDHFGEAVLQADGTLNRRALRERVFTDDEARKALEGITHPAIRLRLQQWREGLTAVYGVLSAAILVEAGLDRLCDRVLVVDASVETQRRRLMARDAVDEALAEQMLAAQATREQRLAAADDVILNEDSVDDLSVLVRHCHQFYLRLARGEANAHDRLRLPATV